MFRQASQAPLDRRRQAASQPLFAVVLYKGWFYIRCNGCDYVSNAKGQPYGYSSYAEASAVCGHHNYGVGA